MQSRQDEIWETAKEVLARIATNYTVRHERGLLRI